VAGLLAAMRTRMRYDPAHPATHPSALRAAVISSADRGALTGHSPQLGWGIVDGPRLYQSLHSAGLV